MTKIKVNNVELYYEQTGKGKETIVFAHGLLWSGKMFGKQVEALQNDYQCITYDHRGQGNSEPVQDGYDMETVYEDAVKLIEALGVAPCHFIGLSMGGFVGMRLAARRPDLLKSLILLETSADTEPEENIGKYKLLNNIVKWIGFTPVVNKVMKIMFGKSFLNDPKRSEEKKYWKNQLLKNNRKSIVKATLGVINRKGVYEELP